MEEKKEENTIEQPQEEIVVQQLNEQVAEEVSEEQKLDIVEQRQEEIIPPIQVVAEQTKPDNKKQKPFTTGWSVGKGFIFIGMFAAVFLIFLFTKAPAYFDSYVYYEDHLGKAHALLFLYRALIYLTFPLIVTIFEKMKYRDVKFLKLLVNNFNIQFCAYAVIAGIYALAGLDKYFGVEVFGTSDAFLFITGFIFTLILEKKLPNLYDTNKE